MRKRRPTYARSKVVLAQNADAGLKPESGRLPVSCWCERHLVSVRVADVQAGRTASCGHPHCRAPSAG